MPSNPLPFFRDAGAGPGVVCLHSNASTSTQWRGLMDLLAPRCRVLAPDLFGAGRGAAWPADRSVTLHDEAARLEPVFEAAGAPLSLVGHSFGGSVALIAALARPERVRAVAVYEPTLFSLLEQEQTAHPDGEGIRNAVVAAAAALDAGDTSAAAEHFIDYWMGAGAWKRVPPDRQAPIAASMTSVRGWATALMTEPTPLAAFRGFDRPVLYMVGARSPASSRSVARLLTATLPNVRVVEFPELGHMGPVTHAQTVNAAIAAFLAEHAAQ
jgi:pimeloyl-ACP methyl ester carboxylesterase